MRLIMRLVALFLVILGLGCGGDRIGNRRPPNGATGLGPTMWGPSGPRDFQKGGPVPLSAPGEKGSPGYGQH